MNKEIIAFILAIAFTFSMAGSAGAATFEELQTQISQLLIMIVRLQARIAQMYGQTTIQQPITTTTITSISLCGQEGEKLNRNPFFGTTNKVCCPGLTDIRESKSYSVCVNCGDGICKYPENSTNCSKDCHNIQPSPACQWCGKACTRVYSWMYCPHISPPQGYVCREINGQCRSTFTPSPTIPPTTTTTIPPTTSLPDLTISNITADKTTLNIGESTRILATEKNIGNNSAGHHHTGIFEDRIETPIGSEEINTIAPGYGLTINANYTCFRAGSHTITALADFIHKVPTGEVVEFNENNNSKTITINCIASPINTTTTAPTTNAACTDSDGGDNIYVAGFVTGNYYPTLHSEVLSHGTGTGLTKTFTDYCESNTILKEFYCVSPNVSTALSSGNEIVDVSYSCPSGYICQNGACKYTTPKINLVIDPSSIYEGQPTTIIWNVSPTNNISYCRAWGGSGDWFGIKDVSGQEIIHPIRSRYQDYVLTCVDKDGRSTSASAGVAFLSATTSYLNSINEALNSLKASLISIVELLK